jgi:hypothetical protein
MRGDPDLGDIIQMTDPRETESEEFSEGGKRGVPCQRQSIWMVGSVEARIRRVKDLKEVVSRMSLKKADRRKMRHLEREAGMRQE